MVRRTKNLIGFYRSKKRKVNGRKVWTGPKNGMFYATASNNKSYIRQKYRKNVQRVKRKKNGMMKIKKWASVFHLSYISKIPAFKSHRQYVRNRK